MCKNLKWIQDNFLSSAAHTRFRFTLQQRSSLCDYCIPCELFTILSGKVRRKEASVLDGIRTHDRKISRLMRYRCATSAALMPSRPDEALKRSLPGSEEERDDDRGYRHQDVLVHGEGGHQLLDTHLDQTKKTFGVFRNRLGESAIWRQPQLKSDLAVWRRIRQIKALRPNLSLNHGSFLITLKTGYI